MTTHELKTHPPHFADVAGGVKTAELRRDDRGYAVGDTLVLREWEPALYAQALADGSTAEEATAFAYTGEAVRARVTHILRGGPWLAEGYAMLSIHLFDPDCFWCQGAGEYFGHAATCADDLCAINGDEHSCAGQMWPCDCAPLIVAPSHPGVAAAEAR